MAEGVEGRYSGQGKGAEGRIDIVLADVVAHTETGQLGAVLVGLKIWKWLEMP